MTFEPASLHQHVLNFYRSTGVIGTSPDRVRLSTFGPHRVHGSGQYFEQTLYFLLGHLLPECNPLHGELHVTTERLSLQYSLGGSAKTHVDSLCLKITEDRRFQHLLDKIEAKCQLMEPGEGNAHFKIGVDLPINGPASADGKPAMDLRNLLDRFSDPEIAAQMAEWFVTNAPDNVFSIRDCLRRDDWAEAHRVAHTLKGSALNVGAGCFARAAKETELAIKERRCQSIPQLLDRLESESRSVTVYWNNHRGELYG